MPFLLVCHLRFLPINSVFDLESRPFWYGQAPYWNWQKNRIAQRKRWDFLGESYWLFSYSLLLCTNFRISNLQVLAFCHTLNTSNLSRIWNEVKRFFKKFELRNSGQTRKVPRCFPMDGLEMESRKNPKQSTLAKDCFFYERVCSYWRFIAWIGSKGVTGQTHCSRSVTPPSLWERWEQSTMREYGIVSPMFWVGETGRALRKDPNAQRVAISHQTSPPSDMNAVEYCPLTVF